MLSRAECFKILGLEESAGPNAIKRAYRKLAFELHPDLHPEIPEAGKRFQRLNEAYVMLMHEYSNTSFRSGGASRRASGQSAGQSAGRASGGQSASAKAADERARDEARRAYEKASSRFGAGASAQEGASAAGAGSSGAAGAAGATGPEAPSGATAGAGAGQYRSQGREEILRDLLNDPFARRVFEDIYSHVRHGGIKDKAKAAPPPRPKCPQKAQARPASGPTILEKMGGTVASMAGGVKSWLRRQIDDDQIMFLPGESLVPGARVRLQVRHGLSEEKRTIEFTLPPEFAPGKPIRLKGLGKRFGRFKGDLYLRVFSNSEDK